MPFVTAEVEGAVVSLTTPWRVTSIGAATPPGAVTVHGAAVDGRSAAQPPIGKLSVSRKSVGSNGLIGHGRKRLFPIPRGSAKEAETDGIPNRPKIANCEGDGFSGGCETARVIGCPTPASTRRAMPPVDPLIVKTLNGPPALAPTFPVAAAPR